MLVLDDRFQRAVIDDDDREFHLAAELFAKAVRARRRLLHAADNHRAFQEREGRQISTVVEEQARRVLENALEVLQLEQVHAVRGRPESVIVRTKPVRGPVIAKGQPVDKAGKNRRS